MLKIKNNIIEDVDTSIINVCIPEGVRTLGCVDVVYDSLEETYEKSIFHNCPNIETFYLSKTVEIIHENTFYNTIKLNSIEVDKENKFYTSIDGVLYNKDVTTLIHFPINKESKKYTLPSSVTKIERCSMVSINLEEIILPFGLESIEAHAFYSTEKIKKISIPSNVSKIGYQAFEGCSNLEEIVVDDKNGSFTTLNGVLYNNDMGILIKYPSLKKDKKFIVENCKVIESRAFSGCGNLEEVVIKEGLELICSENFVRRGIKKISIPSSVKVIEELVFDASISLEEIIVDDSNTNYKTIDNVLFSKDGKYLIKYPSCKKDKQYIIPNTVEFIEHDAFVYNENLEEIILENGVVSIGVRNFSLMKKLKLIKIPSTVKEVWPHAVDFKYDESIKIELCENNKSLYIENNTLKEK